MDERDPRIEVCAESIHQGQGERDLGDEYERGSAGLERMRDRLDIDRRLSAARHPIEQERARVAGRDGGRDPSDGLRLCGEQLAGGRSPATPTGRPGRQRSPRPFADLGVDHPAADEPGHRRLSVPSSKVGRWQFAGRDCGELRQQVDLARAERSSARAFRCFARRHGGAAFVAQADPTLVAGPGTGAEQCPAKPDAAVRFEGAEAAQEARPAVRSGEVAHWPGPTLQLGEQIGDGRIRGAGGGRRIPARRDLRHQLEPLEQSRREHRAEDECGRCEVVRRDRGGEGEGQPRQERSVRPDPVDDRLGRGRRQDGRLGHDDPERLTPTELDEDRLARLEVAQPLGDKVGVGPVAATTRRIHRDLDGTHRGGQGQGDRG